jgi:hypothetical protein
MKIAVALQTSLSLLVAVGVTPVAIFAAEPEGKALYEANCAKCHGPDGKSDTPVSRVMKDRFVNRKRGALSGVRIIVWEGRNYLAGSESRRCLIGAQWKRP